MHNDAMTIQQNPLFHAAASVPSSPSALDAVDMLEADFDAFFEFLTEGASDVNSSQ